MNIYKYFIYKYICLYIYSYIKNFLPGICIWNLIFSAISDLLLSFQVSVWNI